MVWRREVRRLNKQVETLALYKKLKQAAEVKRLMTSRPPWAPDMDNNFAAGWGDMEVEATAASVFNPILSDCDLIKPSDNGSETTNDAPQSVEQDRPIWQQYPQLKE